MYKTLIRLFALLAAVMVSLSGMALAQRSNILNTYWTLVERPSAPADDAQALLASVMDGDYTTRTASATLMAALPGLSALTHDDLMAFAANNKLPVEMVRHGWFIALASAAEAQISRGAGYDADVQADLLLFLHDGSDKKQNEIRRSITPDGIAAYAQRTGLPMDFLEHLILDEDWDDDEWHDDGRWATRQGWTLNWVAAEDVRARYGDAAVVTREDMTTLLRQNGLRVDAELDDIFDDWYDDDLWDRD